MESSAGRAGHTPLTVRVQVSGSCVACFFLQRGVDEPVICYSWRYRWQHLSAVSISHVFKDRAPVCQLWSVNMPIMVSTQPWCCEEHSGPDSRVGSSAGALCVSRKTGQVLPLWSRRTVNRSLVNTLFLEIIPLHFCLLSGPKENPTLTTTTAVNYS